MIPALCLAVRSRGTGAALAAIRGSYDKKAKAQTVQHQLAAQSFEPVLEFADMNSNVKERHEAQLQDNAVVSRMAIHLLGKPKAELVRNLRDIVAQDSINTADEMLRSFVHARELTKTLTELTQATETRYAVAMANVVDLNGCRGALNEPVPFCPPCDDGQRASIALIFPESPRRDL